jgi:glucose/arabinose dehydrogenase
MVVLNFVLSLLTSAAAAQKCAVKIASRTGEPTVSKGFTARVLGNGFTNPRGLVFDSAGHLLVVEKGKGITAITLDGAQCVGIASRSTIVSDSSVRPKLYHKRHLLSLPPHVRD